MKNVLCFFFFLSQFKSSKWNIITLMFSHARYYATGTMYTTSYYAIYYAIKSNLPPVILPNAASVMGQILVECKSSVLVYSNFSLFSQTQFSQDKLD